MLNQPLSRFHSFSQISSTLNKFCLLIPYLGSLNDIFLLFSASVRNEKMYACTIPGNEMMTRVGTITSHNGMCLHQTKHLFHQITLISWVVIPFHSLLLPFAVVICTTIIHSPILLQDRQTICSGLSFWHSAVHRLIMENAFAFNLKVWNNRRAELSFRYMQNWVPKYILEIQKERIRQSWTNKRKWYCSIKKNWDSGREGMQVSSGEGTSLRTSLFWILLLECAFLE